LAGSLASKFRNPIGQTALPFEATFQAMVVQVSAAEVTLGHPDTPADWLDQSWWPGGEYTASTDAALKFDLQAVKDYGLNMVRLHQKVTS